MKTLFTAFFLFFSSLVLAVPLNNIVVFGDSLSDNGNLYEYMGGKLPQSPPYYKGRFSNGPVWVELLAASYFPENAEAHVFDYAFGGASVSQEKEEMLFTLDRELDIYLNSHQGKADKNSLFVVWIGSNNYLGMPEEPENILKEVNTGIKQSLQRLVDAGAKHILVMGVPDLGRTPMAADFNIQDTLSFLSSRHNELLLQAMDELQQANTDVQWIYFDVSGKFNELMNHPESFGLNNITGTCYDAGLKQPTKKAAIYIASSIKKRSKNDSCDGYVFFDPVHPTAPVHRIIADQARVLLEKAGVELVA
ncbi:GDSL family lysophospholipase PlaA [Legionella fairfieldensis]|uniref:GDSL family lysophospholipase PlaA n=1 Tax=Legionella fairfieldensis TaxID=45064 RepID=UPI0004915EC5|nr:SGNH/GDSL hydrolase family protein [Legionella fairfieldensis]